jgi:heptosyltransferase-2
VKPSAVLVIAPNWVGDSVFMLPAVSALRRSRPGASFTLLAKPGILSLHSASPLFDSFESLGPPGRLRRFAAHWRLRPRHFDAALVFPPSFSSAFAAFLSGASRRVGRGGEGRGIFLNLRLPRADRKKHVSEEYLDLARALGAEPQNEDKSPRLVLTQAGAEEQGRLFREQGLQAGPQLVLLCPTSAFGPSKCWGEERFAALASRLKSLRYQPCLVGAPSELPQLRRISDQAGGLPTLLPSLAGLAACLASAGVVVANDSGPLHIAAAVGARCLGLYGPVSPAWSSPLSHRSTVLYSAEPCSPCYQKVCPLGHHACMVNLSVDSAVSAVVELLKR